jgi:HEAT repeat protein
MSVAGNPRTLSAYYFFQKGAFAYLVVLFTSQFLQEFGAAGLPWYYVLHTLLFVATQLAMMRFTSWKGGGVLSRLLPALGCFALAMAVLGQGLPGWVILLALVGSRAGEMHANQAFFDLSGQILPVREAKQRLPGIMAAGTVGSVLAGLSLRFLMGEGTLPWFLAGAALAFLLAAQILPEAETAAISSSAKGVQPVGPSNQPQGQPSEKATPGSDQAAPPGIMAVPPASRSYVVIILVLSAAGSLTCGLIDFLFNGRLAVELPDSHQIATFLGLFQAMVDLTVLVIQGACGGWFFRRLPLAILLSIRPVALCSLCLLAWWFPVFLPVVVCQFAMRTTTSIFMSPAWVLLLEPLPAGPRLQARRLLNILDALTTLGIGLGLMAWTRSGGGADPGLYAVDAVLLAGTMALTGALVRLYPRMIQDTLESAPAAERSGAMAGVRFLPRRERMSHLQSLLGSPDPEVRGEAIRECARDLDDETLDVLLTAVAHEEHGPNVTLIVRAVMAQCGEQAGPVLAELLHGDQDPRLLADLLEAIGRSDHPELEQVSARFIEHPHRRVRGAAALNLLRHGRSRERLARTIDRLADDVASPDPATRATAAVVLGRTHLTVFLPVLMHLADDPDDMPARKALGALADFRQPSVLEFLLARTSSPGTRGDMARQAWNDAANVERSSLLQLLHGLPEEERRRIGFWWQSLGAGLEPSLVQKLLRLEDSRQREVLMQALGAGLDSAGGAAVVSACLTEKNGRTVIRSEPLMQALAQDPWDTLPLAATLIPPVCGPQHEGLSELLFARVLTLATHAALLGRTRLAPAGPPGVEATNSQLERMAMGADRTGRQPAGRPASARWASRFEVFLRLLELWGGDPGAWHDAVEKARTGDKFLNSVAQEFLEARLGNRFARILLPLLDPHSDTTILLEALQSAGVADLATLSEHEAAHRLAAYEKTGA